MKIIFILLMLVCVKLLFFKSKKFESTLMPRYLITHIDGSLYKETDNIKVAKLYKSKGFMIKVLIAAQHNVIVSNL